MTSRTNERRRRRRPVAAAVYLHRPFRRCPLLFDVNVQTRDRSIWQSEGKTAVLSRNGTLANKEPRILEIKYPRRSLQFVLPLAARSRLKYPVTFNIADISSTPAITTCIAQPACIIQSRER